MPVRRRQKLKDPTSESRGKVEKGIRRTENPRGEGVKETLKRGLKRDID